VKVGKTGISFGNFVFFGDLGLSSFGNFVFLGLRSNSGIRHQCEVDLYLRGMDGFQVLTDYGCSFVVQKQHVMFSDLPLGLIDVRPCRNPAMTEPALPTSASIAII
jgi:hypothetical protein